MAQANKTPESLADVKKHIFRNVWIWLGQKPRWVKIIFSFAGVILLLIVARLNFLGEPFYRYSKLLLPASISAVDPTAPVIPLFLSYEIEDSFERRPGKLGDTSYDGDHLFISFKAGIQCWVSVFGVDSNGIHAVFRHKLDPSLIEKGQTYTPDFELDKTVGNEIYYAIAASEPFNFHHEIEPHLKNVFGEGNSKGPSFSEYQLRLPEKFTQKFIYFKHLSRQGPTSLSDTSSGQISLKKIRQGGLTKKLALLVGINEYKSPTVKNLNGCVNDVENMRTLLITKFDFKEENIQTLTNKQATRDAILQTFQNHLIARAAPGAIVVFHYSGHGSQMKDISGDEIDNLDETIVPHDSRQGTVFDISDDELNGLLRLLSQKTKNITFILDSCHSGTATRAAGLARKIPIDERPPPPPPPYALSVRDVGEGENDWRPENLNYVLISGCRSGESSFEHWGDGKEHGALTYFLTKELRSAGAAVTYRDIMDNVMGKVNAFYGNQHPQLEGVAADYYVFSDSTSIADAYILTSPHERDRKKVTLDAGQIQGLTEGSIFEVYKPGTKKFEEPEKPIATVELTNVMSGMAEGIITSGRQVPEFSRAVERQHYYPDLKLRLYYMELSESPTLQSIKAQLDEYNYIETVAEPRHYHLLLRQISNEIVTEGGDTTEISPRVSISDPDAVRRVVAQVSQWAKWFNILSIDNVAPVFDIKFTLKVVRDGQSRAPFAHVGQAEAVVYPGERVECIVENTSHRDLYLTMLDLSTDGSVSVIYPDAPGAAELLPARSTWSKPIEMYLPAGLKSVKDILKVFATTTKIDFYFLTQPAVRGEETRDLPQTMNDPLGQLLANATLGMTRGGRRPAKLDSWATVQRVLEVKQKSH